MLQILFKQGSVWELGLQTCSKMGMKWVRALEDEETGAQFQPSHLEAVQKPPTQPSLRHTTFASQKGCLSVLFLQRCTWGCFKKRCGFGYKTMPLASVLPNWEAKCASEVKTGFSLSWVYLKWPVWWVCWWNQEIRSHWGRRVKWLCEFSSEEASDGCILLVSRGRMTQASKGGFGIDNQEGTLKKSSWGGGYSGSWGHGLWCNMPLSSWVGWMCPNCLQQVMPHAGLTMGRLMSVLGGGQQLDLEGWQRRDEGLGSKWRRKWSVTPAWLEIMHWELWGTRMTGISKSFDNLLWISPVCRVHTGVLGGESRAHARNLVSLWHQTSPATSTVYSLFRLWPLGWFPAGTYLI